VLRGEGRAVTVVESEDRVLKRVTAPAVSEFFDMMHRGHGVNIQLGVRLAAILGETRTTGVALADSEVLPADVVLADSEVLPADVVLLATGARANDELARSAGIACNEGILVDEFTSSSILNISAIGDCTRLPSRRYRRRLRLESVQNAIDQAKAASAALLGEPVAYDPVPWFWSDQYDIKLQIAGLSDDRTRCDIVGEPAAARFSAEYRRDGRLVAVDAVNDARAHMLARRRIADETAVRADVLEGAA
jgi:3-phenylpropionate/trans-cinnamate dioxygenase ferredoxin reductase subunit